MSTHYVYRTFDADGRLLYIGCTKDVVARLAQHKRVGTGGGRAIHSYVADAYPTREAGRCAEAAAIFAEQPPHNTRLRRPHRPLLAVAGSPDGDLFDRLAHAIGSRATYCGLDLDALAERAGMSSHLMACRLRDTGSIKTNELAAIADALGTTVSALVNQDAA